jgi:predicted membrane protein
MSTAKTEKSALNKILQYLIAWPLEGQAKEIYVQQVFKRFIFFCITAFIFFVIVLVVPVNTNTRQIMIAIVFILAGMIFFLYQVAKGRTYYQLMWRQHTEVKQRTNNSDQELLREAQLFAEAAKEKKKDTDEN